MRDRMKYIHRETTMTMKNRTSARKRFFPLLLVIFLSLTTTATANAQNQQHHAGVDQAMSDSTMQAMRGRMMQHMDPQMAEMHATMMSQMDSTMVRMHDQMMQKMMGMHGKGMMMEGQQAAGMDQMMKRMAGMHETMMPMMQHMMQRLKNCNDGN